MEISPLNSIKAFVFFLDSLKYVEILSLILAKNFFFEFQEKLSVKILRLSSFCSSYREISTYANVCEQLALFL